MNIIARYVRYQKLAIVTRLKLNGAVVLLTNHNDTPTTSVDPKAAPRPTCSEQTINVVIGNKRHPSASVLQMTTGGLVLARDEIMASVEATSCEMGSLRIGFRNYQLGQDLHPMLLLAPSSTPANLLEPAG